MNSIDFFKDTEFNSKFKNKAGIYVIENPLFTEYLGYPVYKIGYARHSLYTRVQDYRTAYGLVPYKIHLLYLIPQKVSGKRVLYTYLTERIIQETLRRMDFWTGRGEWFKEIGIIMNVIQEVRRKHLSEIKASKNWLFWSPKPIGESVKKIKLVDEKEISGVFKDLIAGRRLRSNVNEDPNEDEEFEEVIINNKRLKMPTKIINEEGEEEDI